MDIRINRGATDTPLVFTMVLASDHRTPATGLSPAVLLSKACGPWAAPAGAVSELGDGWYQVAASAIDTNTIGPLILHATAASADPVDSVYEIVPAAGLAPIVQNTASYPLRFLLISASDHVTGLTGAAPTVLLAKTGSAFAAPAGAVVELGYGWYYVVPNATDVSTVGPLLLHAMAAGADPADERFDVVPLALPSSARYGNGPSLNVLRNSVNTFRLTAPNQDADGALQNGWTALATNVRCSVQPGSQTREMRQNAIRQITPFSILFGTNPDLTIGDQIQWTDDLGTLHTIIITATRNQAGRGTAFLATGEEVI